MENEGKKVEERLDAYEDQTKRDFDKLLEEVNKQTFDESETLTPQQRDKIEKKLIAIENNFSNLRNQHEAIQSQVNLIESQCQQMLATEAAQSDSNDLALKRLEDILDQMTVNVNTFGAHFGVEALPIQKPSGNLVTEKNKETDNKPLTQHMQPLSPERGNKDYSTQKVNCLFLFDNP